MSNQAVAHQKTQHSTVTAFDKLLSEQFKPNEPGASVLIAQRGKVIYKKTLGMGNLELSATLQSKNVFRIGSITKQFTAVAILQLMEKGKLRLEDEITRYIPDYPTHGTRITLENLLTHTSGIVDYSRMTDTFQRERLDFSPVQMINYFKDEALRFTPGTQWEYSNSGYFLLGYIIEIISGQSYAQYLEENIFKPVGMKGSSYANDQKLIKGRVNGYSRSADGFENSHYMSMTRPYAAGSILSTAEDLFLWQQALVSNKLVKKETLAKAFSRYTLENGQEVNYGYGWRMGFVQESPSLWHGGLINGFFTMAMYLPKEDVFVVVLTNCDCNPPVDITSKLAAVAIGKPYDYKEIKLESSVLEQYPGVYENARGQQRVITLSGNQLKSQAGKGPQTVVKPYRKDHFFFENGELQSLEFRRAKSGLVEDMIVKNRLSIEVWTKTTKPIPNPDGISVDEAILQTYTGVYAVNPDFSFTVSKEGSRLFLQAEGQEKFEMFAESPTHFFLKVNDAQIEFISESGKIVKAKLSQGGRSTDAIKEK